MEIFFGIAAVIGVLIAFVLAILWIVLPFAVFGIKNRLDGLSRQLKEMITQLQRMSVFLDPDGRKSQLHAEHVGRQRRQVAEERRRNEIDQEKLKAARKRDQEDRKLANCQASFDCPSCNRSVSIQDLRTGSKHNCPHCNQAFRMS